MKHSRFAEGWHEERVRPALEHYESRKEDEAIPQDKAAFEGRTQSILEVPVELVPAVRDMIANNKGWSIGRRPDDPRQRRNRGHTRGARLCNSL